VLTISVNDAATCFDVVEQCTDMGGDPAAWQEHLTASVERLIGGCAGTFAISRGSGDAGVEVQEACLSPTDQSLRTEFAKYIEVGAFALLPEMPTIAPAIRRDGKVTYRQSDLVARRDYFRCEFYQHYMRNMGVDDSLTSVELRPDGLVIGLSLMRVQREQRFSQRDLAMLELLTHAVSRRVDGKLVTHRGNGSARLPPRLRDTLDALLDGASEKEAARRLGIAPSTVHEYVTKLYRRFGVTSRRELMSRFLRARTLR
jgi:DNA-binding CsgD family transcriptional regulator